MPTYIMLSTLTPEGVQTVKNNPERIPRGQQGGRAARRERQGAGGDARARRHVDAPRVGIVMGSKSDMEAMEKAAHELEAAARRHGL